MISSKQLFYRSATCVAVLLLSGGLLGLSSRTYADGAAGGNTSSTTPSAPSEVTTTPVASRSIVTTGTATAVAHSLTTVNTNAVTSEKIASTTLTAGTTTSDAVHGSASVATTTLAASTTPDTAHSLGSATTTPSAATTTPDLATTTVMNANTASTTNRTSASATTGGNNASDTAKATVTTGDAYASANSVTIINTNIIDSTGLLEFSNLFSALGIDLRGLDLSYFTAPSTGSTSCSLTTCGSTLDVVTHNDATTTNTVSAVADTGSNTASASGNANVTTGNAYASGNAVNLVNSNIIRSNYLLVGINNFGNLNGGIVLPGASFFETLLAHNSPLTGSTNLLNESVGNVTDSTAAQANTGGNSASTLSGGTAGVTSGSALTSATTLNQVNTNQTGGTSLFFLFRIWGNWTGTVRGLPSGMKWAQTPLGVELMNANGSSASLNQLAGSGNVESTPPPAEAIAASSTSAAVLKNAVSVYALTGNNEASAGKSGATAVATGNAYAAANSVNIVNTNIVGHNWIYAIFNIFGNLAGDISFGRPDLWLGATAATGNPTLPGSLVTFRFTVANRGDAAATNVRLSADFLKQMLAFTEGSTTPSGESWNLGTVAVGQTKELVYTARVGSLPAGESVAVPFTATVTSDETDNNPIDNTDSLTMVVTNPGTGGGTESFTSDPKISIVKTADVMATSAPATIHYAVDIKNAGGPAYGALATDTLTGPSGAIVNTQSWNLDTLNYKDEVKITYAVVFAAGTKPGAYTNTITVTGHMHYPDGAGSVALTPASAHATITIVPIDPPQVVAPPPAPTCSAYLTVHIEPGIANNRSQVRKLQLFLRDGEAENGVQVTGVYDAKTEAAVKRFQEKYADKILAPWGFHKPTGIVYYTTEQQINDIWCSGRRSFGLTSAQADEITTTAKLIAQLRAAALTHTASLSRAITPNVTATTSKEASSTDPFTLPPGMQVGIASTGEKTGRTAGGVSWLSQLFAAPQALMANALGAFSSMVNAAALW